MSRTTLKQKLPTQHYVSRPLTGEQEERYDRMLRRALACLDRDDFEEFWTRMDALNFYVAKVKQ